MKDPRFTLPPVLLTLFEFLLKYRDLLSVWAGILVWEALTKRPLTVEVKWSLYFGAFAAASFFNWRKAESRALAAEAALEAETRKSNPVRIFAENPEGLLERYADTGTLAEKLLVPYLDKWTRISGSFEGAADSLLGDAVFISLILESGRRVQLRFPPGQRDRLRVLREGQRLTAVCQIRHGHGAGVFTLENCELIEVESFRPALARAS